MTYTSSKVIELGSTAFRQPNASSHCKYLHGYQLKAQLTFGCNKLDDNNWVFDFGGLKDLKAIFNNQFDHTTVISGTDPEIETFKDLQNKGIVQLRILDGGVGIEKFAEWVYKTADIFLEEVTEGRVWVEKVTVYEHESNYASVNKTVKETTTFVDEEGTTTYVEPEPEPKLESPTQPGPPTRQGAPVGQRPTQGKGNWFEGTTWG